MNIEIGLCEFCQISTLFNLLRLDALRPPTDLRVYVSGVKATLVWVLNDDLDLVRYFRITYEIFNNAGSFLKISHNIDGIRRSYTLRGLTPLSTYKVFMVTIGSGEVSNASETIEFSTAIPENVDAYPFQRSPIYAEEAIIIIIIVLIWLVAVTVFVKQWDSIRILQPMEPRYKHNPKNLETVRVVKRPQDSVIYKGYSRKLSVTMIEREKRRLQRMHTAPVLPTCTLSRMNTLPTIQMEDVTTEM